MEISEQVTLTVLELTTYSKYWLSKDELCLPKVKELIQQLLTSALQEKDAEIGRLRECLQPGTAPAIMNGLFREAERLGFYTPTGKHALTQFVEEVEKLRNERDSPRATMEELKKYARHNISCAFNRYTGYGCTCGLSKLLEGIKR